MGAKCAEAKCPILGGHTVEDTEPKYGLAVVGTVHPDQVWRNNGLHAGDKLLLTKPLGTGILSTAMKRGALDSKGRDALIANLVALNSTPAICAREHATVHAATDITGFGLLGHLREMLTPVESQEGPLLCAVISASATPLLPDSRDL